MKKLAPLLSLVLAAAWLAACAPLPSTDSQVAPVPTQSSVPSFSAPASKSSETSEGIPASLSEGHSAAHPQAPDATAFTDMFRHTMFSLWVDRGYDAATEFPTDPETAWRVWGLLTWARQWQDTGKMDESGKQGFTEAEIAAVSQDVLGYVYDLSVLPGYEDVEGIPFLAGFGPAVHFQPVEGSYACADGIIQIDSAFEFRIPDTGEEEADRWTMRYTFQYLPENAFPYRLMKSELVDGAYPASYT